MGRTHGVPRNVKGEGRFLLIFSTKSLATTIAGGAVAIPLFAIFSAFGLNIAGIASVVVFAVIGFGIGTLTIPDTPLVGNLRKAGGEPVLSILTRTITFKSRKKIFLYRPKHTDETFDISKSVDSFINPGANKKEKSNNMEVND